MRSIYKFTLETVGTELQLPEGAKVVHVHEQGGKVCMWVDADWSQEKATRYFGVCGTGHKVSAGHVYIGTAHLVKLGLVLHVFEVI